jgi:hypothetical protein
MPVHAVPHQPGDAAALAATVAPNFHPHDVTAFMHRARTIKQDAGNPLGIVGSTWVELIFPSINAWRRQGNSLTLTVLCQYDFADAPRRSRWPITAMSA